MASHVLSFRKRLRYLAEASAVYLFYGIFRLLPLDAASACGGFSMARLGMHLGATRTALRNLARAFPQKTEAEHKHIVRGMWENLGRIAGEYPHLHRIGARIALEGNEHLAALAQKGGPAVFLAAHLANWEINAVAARVHGIPLAVVYRRPNNPYVDGLLRHARNSGAVGHIPKGRAGIRDMVDVVKKRGFLGLMIDQKLNEGIPVPFFGENVMTAPAPAQLALKIGCPLYLSCVERIKGASFRVTISPPVEIKSTGDDAADTLRIMTEINAAIESWIRAKPEQWLWIHRRWPE